MRSTLYITVVLANLFVKPAGLIIKLLLHMFHQFGRPVVLLESSAIRGWREEQYQELRANLLLDSFCVDYAFTRTINQPGFWANPVADKLCFRCKHTFMRRGREIDNDKIWCNHCADY